MSKLFISSLKRKEVGLTQPWLNLNIAMNDHKLPELARALNNEEMRSLFSGHWARLNSPFGHTERPEGPFTGREICEVRHLVLKHTPGKRCVIEYWLELSGTHQQTRRVIGKMYRFDRGEKIFANLRALWNAAHSQTCQEKVLGMPQPLAYLPELGMIIQDVVPGRQLSRFTADHYLPQAVRRVASNLAALHGLTVSVSEKNGLNDHLKKYCHPGPEVLGEACPELRPLVGSILRGLAADPVWAGETAPMCPVHGDLGLSQIFVSEDRAFFIDFDDFCLSHAALDLSNFLVALKVHFALQSDALTKVFLETYVESQSPERFAGFRIYHALTYLRRAMICFRWKSGPEWRQQVRQLLETSNAVLNKKYF